MIKGAKKSKTTLDKLAQMTQKEFLVLDKKIDGVRENMATKDNLKFFATKVDLEDMRVELKSDIQKGTVEVLRGVDKIVTRLDRTEKEEAAHTRLHQRITDEFHSHDIRLKKVETKV